MKPMPSDQASRRHATRVRVQSVRIRYGDTLAVRDVDLEGPPGEILALVGPSGCGKTSLLKSVAGLEPLDSGAVWFDDERIDMQPSHRRRVGMVFQNYALFPHMRVAENVAFGLRMSGIGDDRGERVARALDMLRIAHLSRAWPDQLSGGQQQRVALARTLVVQPRVLLLDEPLSALDRQLRDAMRSEIRQLVKQVGITTLLVTHDQDEALSMADRIAIMRNGRIEQLGAPRELFDAPRTAFVGQFLGRSNALQARCTGVDGPTVRFVAGALAASARWSTNDPLPRVDDVLTVLLRFDGIAMQAGTGDAATAVVVDQVSMGDKTELRLQLDKGQAVRTEVAPGADVCAVGTRVRLDIDSRRAFAFPATDG